jgi:Lrp/AsnC family transcriptional regulator for asnA, asnC and gidA
MDKTDMALCMLLLANSQISYKHLADNLDLSVNAVHKRIQLLIKSGVIRRFTARISLLALGATTVWFFGVSNEPVLQNLNDRLGEHGSIYWLAIAGGNYLLIGAFLKRISELESLVEYLKKEAKMPNPTVGIVGQQYTTKDVTLYPLDLQIIRALKDNSRKPLADVAEELGVSAKTVRRRLSRMITNGLIELSLEWYPDASDDIMTLFHFQLKISSEKSRIDHLFKEYPSNVLFHMAFSNLPNEIIAVVWTNTMKQLKDIQASFEQAKLFESIIPNVLYTGYIFDTWRDRQLFQ